MITTINVAFSKFVDQLVAVGFVICVLASIIIFFRVFKVIKRPVCAMTKSERQKPRLFRSQSGISIDEISPDQVGKIIITLPLSYSSWELDRVVLAPPAILIGVQIRKDENESHIITIDAKNRSDRPSKLTATIILVQPSSQL